jgi:hypothetical protein
MGSRFFSLSSVLSMIALAAAMLLTTPALAKPGKPKPLPRGVPEIDPAGLVAAGTLLAGGLAIARGRRRQG